MNRITLSLAIFALASSLGFAQEQQAPTVAPSDVKIEQLQKTLNRVRTSVRTMSRQNSATQAAQKATLDQIRKVNEQLAKDNAEAANRDRKHADELKRQQGQNAHIIRNVQITGVLLLAIIGGYFGFRVLTYLNSKSDAELPLIPDLVKTAETPIQRLPLMIGLRENPLPDEIRGYFQAYRNATEIDFVYRFGELSITATVVKSGKIFKGFFRDHNEITPCGLDKLYKTAQFLAHEKSEARINS